MTASAVPGRRALLAALLLPIAAQAQGAPPLVIGYLSYRPPRPVAATLLDPPPADEGVQGAQLGLADTATTGRFTGQQFALEERRAGSPEDALAALRSLAGSGVGLVVADLPADLLLRAAELPEASGLALLNIAAPDDALRNAQCRRNLLHILPSRAMLADALAQFLAVKRWRNIFLAVGPAPGDALYAEAMRRAARKFGLRIVAEKPWAFEPGAQRTDTGHVSIAAEAARFTQGAPSYDVLVIADETGDWGENLAWRTTDPRLVAGTQGLMPTIWSPIHEQWGATQLQRRFRARAGRPMTPLDHAAWLAVRAIGEAAVRGGSTDPAKVAAYLRGPAFEVAGFKGTRLTFRDWDGQLRQPVLLAAPRSLVSVSPQPGFQHQFSELDTLGTDRPETILISNEKDNSITVLDGASLKVQRTVKVGERPRGIVLSRDARHLYICAGDSDRVEVLDLQSWRVVRHLPSGSDPELAALHPDGKRLFVANEDDNMVTVVDVDRGLVVKEIPVGVEPEGMGISPDGRFVVNTSETTNMAHVIDTDSGQIVANVLVGARPRVALWEPDGKRFWVSSEIGGTLTLIGADDWRVQGQVSFSIPGVPQEAIQPVGMVLSRDATKLFVALGPANRVAVVDVASRQVERMLLVGQRVWNLALSADGSRLYTTNGVSNDMSVVDIAAMRVTRSVPVGQAPWGVVVKP